jgi:PAS domain S-box-containing protein
MQWARQRAFRLAAIHVKLQLRRSMSGTALAQIESMSRVFFDGIGVGATLSDIHTTQILFANPAFARLVGYTVSELTSGMTFLDLTHPEDRERNFRVHSSMTNAATGHYRIDKRYVRKDGVIVWGRVTGTSISDESGELRWSTGIIEDITEQQLLKQRLSLSEELSGLAAWRWDVKAATAEFSPAYNHVLGLLPYASSVNVDEFLERVHPDDRASVSEFLKSALKGNIYALEYRIVRPDGKIRWLRGMASGVLDGAGEVTELVGATLDITDVKLRTQAAIADKKLLSMMRFLEDNWETKFKVEDIAAKFGISSRKIFRHFASRGTTLMDFVKDIRLQKVRQRLVAPEPTTTVTRVSLECGFNNLGHFARDYRRKFGELPSETLRRHQS